MNLADTASNRMDSENPWSSATVVGLALSRWKAARDFEIFDLTFPVHCISFSDRSYRHRPPPAPRFHPLRAPMGQDSVRLPKHPRKQDGPRRLRHRLPLPVCGLDLGVIPFHGLL